MGLSCFADAAVKRWGWIVKGVGLVQEDKSGTAEKVLRRIMNDPIFLGKLGALTELVKRGWCPEQEVVEKVLGAIVKDAIKRNNL